MCTRSVRMPDRRAASALPPTAYRRRPKVVEETSSPAATATTRNITVAEVSPNSDGQVSMLNCSAWSASG